MSYEMVLLFAAGFFAGFSNTVVGGGSFFSLPVLLLLGLDAKTAVATNRFCIIFLTAVGTGSFYRKNKLNLKRALLLSVFAGAGSVIGAHLVVDIDENLLKKIVLWLLVILFIRFIFSGQGGIHSNSAPREVRCNTITMTLLVFLLGIYGGFFGAAVSVFFIAALTMSGRMPLIEAIATNQVLVFVLSVTASAVFLIKGLIDFTASIPLALGMSAGTFIAARIVSSLSVRNLRIVFNLALGLMILALIFKGGF